jgi:hypothetical protein
MPLPPELEERLQRALARSRVRPPSRLSPAARAKQQQLLEYRLGLVQLEREERRRAQRAEVGTAIRLGWPLPPSGFSRFPSKLD